MKGFKRQGLIAMLLIGTMMLSACGTSNATQATTAAQTTTQSSTTAEASDTPKTLDQITELAKQEGEVVSVGMPDTWANWKDTWADLKSVYGLEHSDTDMSSAEEISKMEAEKDNATADIGDVGIAFAPVAVEKGVAMAYKTSYWDDIPDWAKDDEGYWMLGYTGTIAIITNKNLVSTPPTSWADLLNGDYKVTIGDVGKAAQANNALIACAIANGGDESNLTPGIAFFQTLAKEGRLTTVDPSIANLESGEVEVALMWDFNALNYRDTLGKEDYDVCIPSDGSVISGYATIINAYAPHPNAAMLTREYILSDEGQINLARGYARPIRSNIEMPADVQAMMLSNEEYAKAQPIKDYDAMNASLETLPEIWQTDVLMYLQ